jgi:transcriptional regulator with XRE-family HTH domain
MSSPFSLGWSREGLAEASELHPIYLGDIEQGQKNPPLTNLLKISESLTVTLADSSEKWRIPRVEPREFEPLTSAVQWRQDSLPEISGACKILQIAVFLERSSSRDFSRFTRVAARLLHNSSTLSRPAAAV